jgi:hypothetical protein
MEQLEAPGRCCCVTPQAVRRVCWPLWVATGSSAACPEGASGARRAPAPDSPEIASLCSLTRCPNASCTCSGAWPFVASRVNDPRVAVYGGLSFGLVGSPGTVPAGADGPEDCRHLQSATSPRAASLGSRAGERITRRGRVALGEGRGALSGHRRMVCVLLGSRAALPAKRRTTRKRPRFRRGRSATTAPVLGSGSSVRNRRPAI